MELKRQSLADGIYLSEVDVNKFKSDLVSVNFVIPLEKETAAMGALLPQVLLRGSRNYASTAEIEKRLQYLYSSGIHVRNAKRGEVQIFGLCADMLDNAFVPDGTDVTNGTVELLLDILLAPLLSESGDAFRADYVAREKENLIMQIEALRNNKSKYALARCREEMCRDERYGIAEFGTAAEVAAITPQSLYAFYRDMLRTARIEIFYVGHRASAEALCPVWQDAFGTLARAEQKPIETDVIRSAGTVREVAESCRISQAKLAMGFRTGVTVHDADYHAFSMLHELLSSSPISKLFCNVREKLSLCYYCYAVPDLRKGVMIVSSGIEKDNKENAQNAILEQIRDLADGKISEKEMETAVRSIRNAYNQLGDAIGDLEFWYLGRTISGLSGSPADEIARLEAVTATEIADAAKKITLDTVYFLHGDGTEAEEEEDDA